MGSTSKETEKSMSKNLKNKLIYLNNHFKQFQISNFFVEKMPSKPSKSRTKKNQSTQTLDNGDEKKVLTITKEMLGESSEDEEIVEFTDKEKEEFLRDITSISNDDGETWTCAFCEMEKESTVEKHLFLQYGLVCPSCFDSAMGFDEEDEI